jgi:peptide/nickel transport system substrate-binding protein
MKEDPPMSARRIVPALGAAACLLTALTACAGGSTAAGSSSATDLTVVYANQVTTIDPVQAVQAEVDNIIASLLYDPLVTYNSKDELVGVIAGSFTTEPGATAVDITLRPGLKFHDGSPVTAADVKFTIERDLAVNSGVASYLAGYKSMTVSSPTSFTVHLSAPDSFFMRELSKVYILNSKLVSAHEGADHGQGWLAGHDAGSGPYTLGATHTLADVTVNRWAGYFAFDKTEPTSMELKEVDQSSTEAADLRDGTANIALKLSSADAQAVDGKSGVTTAWINSGLTEYMWMNPNVGPTSNVKVREALQDVYNYEGGLKAVWNGKGTTLSGILPSTMTCQPADPAYAQHLTTAKTLLKQVGVTTLTLRYQPALTEFTQEATLFQSDLKSIGVTLQLAGISLLIMVVIAVPAAVASGLRRRHVSDTVIRGGVVVAAGLPTFWLALVAQLLLATDLRLFPISGTFGPHVSVPTVTGMSVVDALLAGSPAIFASGLYHLLLPATVLALPFTAQLYRALRTEIIKVTQAEFIDAARAKGLSTTRLVTRHVLPNASGPAITILGATVAMMIGSAILVESVFGLDGIGAYLTNAVDNDDRFAVIGGVLVIGAIIVAISFLVDLVQLARDPRLRAAAAVS